MPTKLEKLARTFAKEHHKFKAFVDEKSAKGELIVRFGDLPEHRPLAEARDHLLNTILEIYSADKIA